MPAPINAPAWLQTAYQYLGLHETPGPQTAQQIAVWLHKLGTPWSDDETPWCGTFVAACLLESGTPKAELPQHYYRALAWSTWGEPVQPSLGAIAVKTRKGGGHVGFVVAREGEFLHILGGNQSDSVSIARYRAADFLTFRAPTGATLASLSAPITTAAVQAAGKES